MSQQEDLVAAAFAARGQGFSSLCLNCLKGFDGRRCPNCSPKGLTLQDFIDTADSAIGNVAALEVPVVVRMRSQGDKADMPVVAVAIESQSSGAGPYQLVLDIENPLE